MTAHSRARLPAWATAHGARALRAYGAATSAARLRPDMLIVGTQRGGTTSLFRTLRQHPNFRGPILRKGVHYFDVEYHRGPKWYVGHFPLRVASKARGGMGRGMPVVGEASPYYMSHPLAAERIAGELPTVKLVAVLRDPVERAYSAHAHELARGFETESFERAIELEESRLRGEEERMRADAGYQSHALRHHAYLSRGRYAEQLERLEQWIPRDRILVLDSHQFFASPEAEFARLLGFLGLPPCPSLAYDQHNARQRSPMDERVRARLHDYFLPHDDRLGHWLGHHPSWRTAERT